MKEKNGTDDELDPAMAALQRAAAAREAAKDDDDLQALLDGELPAPAPEDDPADLTTVTSEGDVSGTTEVVPPAIEAPPTPEIVAPPMPEVVLPPMPEVELPPMPEVVLPPMPEVVLPPMPEVVLPPMPEPKDPFAEAEEALQRAAAARGVEAKPLDTRRKTPDEVLAEAAAARELAGKGRHAISREERARAELARLKAATGSAPAPSDDADEDEPADKPRKRQL